MNKIKEKLKKIFFIANKINTIATPNITLDAVGLLSPFNKTIFIVLKFNHPSVSIHIITDNINIINENIIKDNFSKNLIYIPPFFHF